jgi:hypothetical protein
MQSWLISHSSIYRAFSPCASTHSPLHTSSCLLQTTKAGGGSYVHRGGERERVSELFVTKLKKPKPQKCLHVPVFCMIYKYMAGAHLGGRWPPSSAQAVTVRSGPRHQTDCLWQGSPRGGRAPTGAARCQASSARVCLAQLREQCPRYKSFPD